MLPSFLPRGPVFRGKLASASLKRRVRARRRAVRERGIPRQACLGLIEGERGAADAGSLPTRIPRQACLGLIEGRRRCRRPRRCRWVFRGKLASASLKGCELCYSSRHYRVFRGKLASASLKAALATQRVGRVIEVFRGKLASASLKEPNHASLLLTTGPGIPRQACLGLIEGALMLSRATSTLAGIPRQACLGLIEGGASPAWVCHLSGRIPRQACLGLIEG